jgi:hypothetical protein
MWMKIVMRKRINCVVLGKRPFALDKPSGINKILSYCSNVIPEMITFSATWTT